MSSDKQEKHVIDNTETKIAPITQVTVAKNTLTARYLLSSGIIGTLKHRKDIKNSVSYSKKLRHEALKVTE